MYEALATSCKIKLSSFIIGLLNYYTTPHQTVKSGYHFCYEQNEKNMEHTLTVSRKQTEGKVK